MTSQLIDPASVGVTTGVTNASNVDEKELLSRLFHHT